MGNLKAEGTTEDKPEPLEIKIPKRRKKSKAADEGC
jgi:hypothetical protein